MSCRWYRDYASFLAQYFGARKMQKLSVDAHLGCPNRDGTIGRGGCAYCRVNSFAPAYTAPGSADIAEQIERGRQFFGRKYRDMGFLAYFQSYTATHGDTKRLMEMYRAALAHPAIEGLVIGTRPDCIPQELLSQLAALGSWVMVEYGAESAHDDTLRRVNRCHLWADTIDAVTRTARAGLPVGLHLIMGLPGESRADMLSTIDAVNALPVSVVKIHQLQLIRGTRLAADPSGCTIFELDAYLDLCCDIVARLRPDIAIDRFVSTSPADLLVAPRWDLKNYQFTSLLHRRLASRFNALSH